MPFRGFANRIVVLSLVEEKNGLPRAALVPIASGAASDIHVRKRSRAAFSAFLK